MVSKSQINAKNNYEKANPEQAFYWQKKSSAKGYIKPSPKTKLYKLVKTNNHFKALYIDDLKEFQNEIKQTLKELEK